MGIYKNLYTHINVIHPITHYTGEGLKLEKLMQKNCSLCGMYFIYIRFIFHIYGLHIMYIIYI
jgi:hypothetical protein